MGVGGVVWFFSHSHHCFASKSFLSRLRSFSVRGFRVDPEASCSASALIAVYNTPLYGLAVNFSQHSHTFFSAAFLDQHFTPITRGIASLY